MDREAKKLAEQMLDTYGESAMDDRPRVVEWLADHGLDHDERSAEAFERHMRWLWEE
jgi:hypothetical protein